MTRITSQALNKSYGKERQKRCVLVSENSRRWCGRDVARQVVPGAGGGDRKSSVADSRLVTVVILGCCHTVRIILAYICVCQYKHNKYSQCVYNEKFILSKKYWKSTILPAVFWYLWPSGLVWHAIVNEDQQPIHSTTLDIWKVTLWC